MSFSPYSNSFINVSKSLIFSNKVSIEEFILANVIAIANFVYLEHCIRNLNVYKFQRTVDNFDLSCSSKAVFHVSTKLSSSVNFSTESSDFVWESFWQRLSFVFWFTVLIARTFQNVLNFSIYLGFQTHISK